MSDFTKLSKTGQAVIVGGYGIGASYGTGVYGSNEEVTVETVVNTSWTATGVGQSGFTLISRTGQDQITGYGAGGYGEVPYGISQQIDFTAFTQWTNGSSK